MLLLGYIHVFCHSGGITMSKNRNYLTSPRGDGCWAVKKEGSNKASSIHDTQADAWKEARRLARGSGVEALLQGKDGKIRARNSYGNDPYPPEG
jgi:hypothetical protein